MRICLCNTDWTAVSAISNIIIALIAIGTLIFSIYLLLRDNKLREEDLRARLNCSIIKHFNAYYLFIENVGKETAYGINLVVKGNVIDEGLYEQVKETFTKLAKLELIIKAGDKKYFFLCPDKMEKDIKYIWRQKESKDEINQWIDKHEEDKITVVARYNKRYKQSWEFCVKNFNFVGSTRILNPIEEISGVISDLDSYTLDEIKQSLYSIANSLETLNNRVYENR